MEQAVETAERAVAARPDDAGLLGNLALAHLLAGRVEAARKTIQAAVKIDSSDEINARIGKLIGDVIRGIRPAPRSMQDLGTPQAPRQEPPPAKKFWQFWK
jgi:hypothetical protein